MKSSWVPLAVIYDMDGVLIDSEPFWKEAEICAFSKVGIHLSKEQCEETVGMRIDEVVRFWINQFPELDASVENVVNDIMDNMVSLIQTKGKPLPGVLDSLEFFKVKGLKIGLATSSYEILMNAVLEKLDIASYFQVTRSAEKEVYGKPHPAVYINTAKELGVRPEDCLVIEDSYNGMLSGLSAKMKVLVVPEKSHKINPKLELADYHLTSLIEISELF
jgi:sugar-phosphatase